MGDPAYDVDVVIQHPLPRVLKDLIKHSFSCRHFYW
jgi:hypothetical protein